MVLNFYLLPFIIKDTGTGIIMLLAVMPLVCFASAVLYGAKNGFSLLFCTAVAVLYIPTIFIFYNSSALVYAVGYGIIAIVGNIIELLF